MQGIKMSFATNLRVALQQAKEGKDISRQAGEGVWANYVRSTCYPVTPRNMEELDKTHKELITTLTDLKELSKEEKNSLRSAKSVIGKAITNNVDVWQRTEDGDILTEGGNPMPKGKSELSDTKSDFQRLMDAFKGADAKYNSESREQFTREELKQLADAFGGLAYSMVQELEATN